MTSLKSFNGLCSTKKSQHQKGKPFWILMTQERMGSSGVSWIICKALAHHSRHITAPRPHHSIFLQAWCCSFTDQLLFLTPNQQC